MTDRISSKPSDFFLRNKSLILYGITMAAILFFMKWLELRLIVIHHSFEIYAGAIAVIFTLLGIWLARRLAKPKIEMRVVEREIYIGPSATFICNSELQSKLGISDRELEVLGLMSQGLSNQEIADSIFVSLHTVKTHASKIFEKLDARRRTQAIEKAKRLSLIP
jgi:NarL family two-component system response regulator LiaR